ncbi:hypothetical protein ACFFVB_11380 [Formosa undariae]|uniref:Universal stress protein n=1 Tax=Formosa undariae TaxID=1325436 RepID=A0ABV5F2K5_9FLAO
MKTVLIPTDFSAKSLQLIKNAVLHNPNEPIQLVLASGYLLRLSAFNPLRYSKARLIKTLAHEVFNNTLSDLILEHKNKIYNVKIELYTGSSNHEFNDFLRVNNIDKSIIPNTKLCQFPNKKCFDITPLIDHLSPEVSRVAYKGEKRDKPTRFWFLTLKQFSFR